MLLFNIPLNNLADEVVESKLETLEAYESVARKLFVQICDHVRRQR